MLWQLAGFVTLFGFAMWIVGTVRGYTGVASIGAVLIIATGAMVTNDGLEYRTGETHITESTNKTVIQDDFERIDPPQQLSLGGLWMLIGGLLMIHKLNEV